MIPVYSVAFIDQVEGPARSEVGREIRALVRDGFVGYRMEDDGFGGVRLRYFLIRPLPPETQEKKPL